MKTTSTREEAERLINAIAVGAWQFCSREYHIDQVDKALQARDERTVRLIREHRASDKCDMDCWTTIIEAIRSNDAK